MYKIGFLLFILNIANVACSQIQKKEIENNQVTEWKKLTDEDWKKRLDSKEYYVLRLKGTEMAFSGDYWNEKKEGTYVCRACELPLFSSKTKYNSGTGWPSFWEPILSKNIKEEGDTSYGMIRTEVVCGRCESHLGHVFPDGPKPTGLRYCINSISLSLKQEDQPNN